MGQRLVVNVVGKSMRLVSIYYHWGAYSTDSMYIAKELVEALMDQNNPIRDPRLRVLRYIESTGGGINGGEGSSEWEYITKMYPDETFKKEGISLYDGLVAFSKEGIEEMQKDVRGELIINLDNRTVNNTVFWEEWSGDIDAFNESYCYEDDEVLTLEDIPVLNFNPTELPFNEVSDFLEALENLEGPHFIAGDSDVIYTLIS